MREDIWRSQYDMYLRCGLPRSGSATAGSAGTTSFSFGKTWSL